MAKLISERRKEKLIHIRVSPELHTRLKMKVAELRTTIQSWTVTNIRNGLREKKVSKLPFPIKSKIISKAVKPPIKPKEEVKPNEPPKRTK